MVNSIFQSIPLSFEEEIVENLLVRDDIRIERILSYGHSSPETGWYDQEEHEWVMVLEGGGVIEFEDGSEVTLRKGDYLTIPAHAKHRVAATLPDRITLWLAVFYP